MALASLMLRLVMCGSVALLSGCTTSQSSSQVLWHDGKCLFFVDGISAQQAGEMTKAWEFEPCDVKVDSELGESQEGAGDSAEVETP